MLKSEREIVQYPYREAKLVHHDYSGSRPWYIDFSAWDVLEGRLRRRRVSDFNSISGLARRKAYAEKLVADINSMLKSGFHFNEKRARQLLEMRPENDLHQFCALKEAMEKALKIKSADLSHASVLSYRSDLKAFLEWAERQHYAMMDSRSLGTEVGLQYSDFLAMEQHLVGKTINGRMSCLKSLAEVAFKRKLLGENIFRGVAKRKEVITKKNLAYTDEQIGRIKRRLLEADPELWNFCMFVFYTFMRPTEIRSLRVENVDFKRKKIYLAAANSKVKEERYVEIPEGLRQILEQMPISWGQKKEYLFKSHCGDSSKPISKNLFAAKYREILDDMYFEKHYTIYSWKHTGNVKAYQSGIGIHAIMRQNGHSNIETTMNYLKSLGLMENREFSEKFNSIVL